jgi:dihydroxyacetone kinase-like protein
MGPIYGILFKNLAEAGASFEEIGALELHKMLDYGLAELRDMDIDAKVGDKTLIDTYIPAKDALEKAAKEGLPLADALFQMKAAADAGYKSTKDLVSKVGRSSRLGERSKGVLDPGATSCFIILEAIADEMIKNIG